MAGGLGFPGYAPTPVIFTSFGCPPPAALALPHNAVELPPAPAGLTTPIEPNYVELMRTEAQSNAPRQINAWSSRALPFDLQIKWTAGGGQGGAIRLTASSGGLTFYVRCKTIEILAGNWTGVTNPVQVSIDDGALGQVQDLRRVTRELNLAAGGVSVGGLPVYARDVWVQPSNPAQAAGLLIEFLDSAGAVMSAFTASQGRVPVGAASQMRLTNTNPGAIASWIGDFNLGYR